MPPFDYHLGLTEIGQGVFAYLQPHGGWGLSNAGLVVDGEASLLVDTLFDKAHTERMLADMRRVSRAAEAVDVVVNTHANGDHCWGNELVRGARIITSVACAEEMAELGPHKMAGLMKAVRIGVALGPLGRGLGHLLGTLGLVKASALLEAAPFVAEIFGAFDFRDTELVLPSETFTGTLTLQIGGRRVELVEVGPAHTRGDIMVHLPDAKIVFTGDVIFAGAHPIAWAGPISNWQRACERILELDPEIVVPGHGPITNQQGVRRMADYLAHLSREARQRFEAGMSAGEAARDIPLGPFQDWREPERLAVNVESLYREFAGDPKGADAIPAFASMARLAAAKD
jgi:cyclase